METCLADVCSRTAVRSRLNRYLCKWLSIILSGQSGEQLQRNCMSTEIICISLRANYWLSCLRGFNRRPAVIYSFIWEKKKSASEAHFYFFFAYWLKYSTGPEGYVFIWQGSFSVKLWSVTLVISTLPKERSLFMHPFRFLLFQLRAYMWCTGQSRRVSRVQGEAKKPPYREVTMELLSKRLRNTCIHLL